MYLQSLHTQLRVSPTKIMRRESISPYASSSGLELWPVVILSALGVGTTLWASYSIKGLLSESERRNQIKEALRQLLLNRPTNNPAFVNAWPKFSQLDGALLLTVALELGMEVVTPTPIKGNANVLLATSPTGSHIVVMQNPVDMAKVYNVDDKIDLASANKIIGEALTSRVPNGWFTQKIANDWAKKLYESGNVSKMVLRSRPLRWGFLDWMLLGGGIVVAGYFGYKLYRKRSYGASKASESDILQGVASAFKKNPRGVSEAELNRAIDRYRKFHWGNEPTKTEEYEVDDVPPVVNEHGDLVGVVYKTNKKGDGETVYVHQFDDPKPKLVSNNDWNQLYILGGKYKIAPEGIVR